jgi:hypothetical protein
MPRPLVLLTWELLNWQLCWAYSAAVFLSLLKSSFSGWLSLLGSLVFLWRRRLLAQLIAGFRVQLLQQDRATGYLFPL